MSTLFLLKKASLSQNLDNWVAFKKRRHFTNKLKITQVNFIYTITRELTKVIKLVPVIQYFIILKLDETEITDFFQV